MGRLRFMRPRRGHFDLAQFLVEHGANAAAQDQGGLTPLHHASQLGHLDLAQFFIEHRDGAAAADQTTPQVQQELRGLL